MWELAVSGIVGYLVGAVPFGYILGRLLKGVDVRQYGSGATGATNVLRVLGPKAFLATLVLDSLKGWIPVLLAWHITHDHTAQVVMGICAIVGHDFPVYIGFRGGRGVATAFGVYAALLFPLAAGLTALGLFIVLAFRYMSLMSIITVPLGAVVLLALGLAEVSMPGVGEVPESYAVFGLVASALVLLRHTGNIRRLLAGTEPKIGEGGRPRMAPHPGHGQ
jgi:glycerol-3-phosphate acyltransferase PlsY